MPKPPSSWKQQKPKMAKVIKQQTWNRVVVVVVPHEIHPQVDAQFDEELVHLAQIGGVAVRVEQSRSGQRVSNVNSHYLSAAASRQFQNLYVFSVRKWAQQQQADVLVGDELVRRRIRWEKGELGRHGRRHPTHLSLTLL